MVQAVSGVGREEINVVEAFAGRVEKVQGDTCDLTRGFGRIARELLDEVPGIRSINIVNPSDNMVGILVDTDELARQMSEIGFQANGMNCVVIHSLDALKAVGYALEGKGMRIATISSPKPMVPPPVDIFGSFLARVALTAMQCRLESGRQEVGNPPVVVLRR